MPTILRTPEEQFSSIKDFPFAPNYMNVEGDIRMHYVDEGDTTHPIALLLHGEPSWSYLYRKMIPGLVENGFRVIAPDLIGFGKSDKLTEQSDYTYQKHLDWLMALIEQLELKDMMLFCQDWGGLLGLRIAASHPERFSMIVASNTMLPTGEQKVPDAFKAWRAFSRTSPVFDIGQVLNMGSSIDLSEEVLAAYNAPFPDESYKAGARIFPSLVPIEAEDTEGQNNKEAWKLLSQWKKPFLTLFGDKDPITKGGDRFMQKLIPGTQGQDHQILSAGHFIQEEIGEQLAELMVAFYRKNS